MNKVAKFLGKYIVPVGITLATLFPSKNLAQSSDFMKSVPFVGPAPSLTIPEITKNGPTPLEALVNFFNPWVAQDDSNSYNSYKEWISLPSREARIELTNKSLREDNFDTKVDSLKKTYGNDICPYTSSENQIRIGQIANKEEFIKTPSPLGITYTLGSNKIKIPVVQVSTISNLNDAHFINGVLVGDDKGNINPLDFESWYLWSSYEGKDKLNIQPGDGEMKDGPVSIGLEAYIYDNDLKKNLFTYLPGIINFELKNGEATLKDYYSQLITQNPNKIKAHIAKNLEKKVIDSEQFPDGTVFTPQVLGTKLDTTKENTSLPINVSYFDSDTTKLGSNHYQFLRKFFAWIYSGGVTKKDSTTQIIEVDKLTAVAVDGMKLPNEFKLYQNYPNPFNPTTNVKYETSKFGDVRLDVYNTLGQKVYEKIEENVSPGIHEFKDINVSNISSVVYFFRVSVDGKTETVKGILQK